MDNYPQIEQHLDLIYQAALPISSLPQGVKVIMKSGASLEFAVGGARTPLLWKDPSWDVAYLHAVDREVPVGDEVVVATFYGEPTEFLKRNTIEEPLAREALRHFLEDEQPWSALQWEED